MSRTDLPRAAATAFAAALIVGLCLVWALGSPVRAAQTDLVLGVLVEALPPTDLLRRGLDHGVLVRAVLPGTPAGGAGMRVGDVITGFEGEPVRSPAGLESLVEQASQERVVTLTLYRYGNEISRELRLRPPDRDPGIG